MAIISFQDKSKSEVGEPVKALYSHDFLHCEKTSALCDSAACKAVLWQKFEVMVLCMTLSDSVITIDTFWSTLLYSVA